MTRSDGFVVGICYPREWWTEPGAFDAAVAELESISAPDGGSVVVVVEAYEEEHERRSARGVDPDHDWSESQPRIDHAATAAFARMNAILALDLPATILDIAPNLQWVQAFGAGTDHLESCRLRGRGVVLTSSAGSNAVGIAEFALGRVIEHHKRFAETRELQREREWQPMFGRQLAGMTLGLVGFGNICEAVATRAHAFGMRVLATRRSAPADVPGTVDAMYSADHLHEMLPHCDAVIAAVPDSPATRGLFDAATFAAMKPGAFFCNVGRGSLVDEPALVDALESGHLEAAALDVTATEPLPSDDPLWSAPNLALSFHNAAVPEAMFGEVHRIFADNLRRFLAGEPLRNVVS